MASIVHSEKDAAFHRTTPPYTHDREHIPRERMPTEGSIVICHATSSPSAPSAHPHFVGSLKSICPPLSPDHVTAGEAAESVTTHPLSAPSGFST